ncbi:MAG: YraN family protein [Clostridia bacterium]|nr:YraN family protein [Clostridia bacterium]
MTARETGMAAEALACRYLKRKGYRLLARNYRHGRYEIDLVMEDGETLVFVEVKARSSLRFGRPAESVTAAKRRFLLTAALAYMQESGRWDEPARFDVIEVYLPNKDIVHISNAFGA